MLKQINPQKVRFELESAIFFNLETDLIKRHRKNFYYNKLNSDQRWIN